MERYLEQLHDGVQDGSFMSSDTQDEDKFNLDSLLDEIEVIDDLDALNEIENTLLSEGQYKAEALARIRCLNAEMKGEINRVKSSLHELDKLQDKELKRIENLMEMIKIKQQEILQEQEQQVSDLDQFELEVSKISEMFTTAIKIYEMTSIKEQLCNLQKKFEENLNALRPEMENVSEAQNKFKKPTKLQPLSYPLSILGDALGELNSANKRLLQEANKLKRSVDK